MKNTNLKKNYFFFFEKNWQAQFLGPVSAQHGRQPSSSPQRRRWRGAVAAAMVAAPWAHAVGAWAKLTAQRGWEASLWVARAQLGLAAPSLPTATLAAVVPSQPRWTAALGCRLPLPSSSMTAVVFFHVFSTVVLITDYKLPIKKIQWGKERKE